MGGECSSTENHQKQFELVKEIEHISLGQLKIVRKINQNAYTDPNKILIGVRQFTFPNNTQRKHFINYLEQIKQFDNIPTLIKILSYQLKSVSEGTTKTKVIGLKEQQSMYTNISKQLNNHYSSHNKNAAFKSCSSENKSKVTIFMEYHEKTLDQILITKKKNLQQNIKDNKRFNFQSSGIKLCNYEIIDKLGHHQRKYINLYYQQIQILRMIDHVIGALYFLHHFGYGHQAIKTNNILIDNEGKYILIDPKIFELKTNYQQALYYLEHIQTFKYTKKSHLYQQNYVYLAPQLYTHLRSYHKKHRQNIQKADIFSVGMLALQMCLLEIDFDRKIINQDNVQITKAETTKLLLQVRQRYSGDLVDLLKDMLQFDPLKRIDYSKLIDRIQPLLTSNLQRIQKLYSNPLEQTNIVSRKSSIQTFQQNNNISHKIQQFDRRFTQVMNTSKIINERYEPFNRQTIISDEKNILSVLSKISANNRKTHKKQYERKKQFKSTDLYNLYLNEYESIQGERVYEN